jgi:MFS family permease
MIKPAEATTQAWVAPFLLFASTYFVAALLRATTATLAPEFSVEFGLGAADLGLLAGAFFFGFALLQLPLGAALDRFGPRRVECSLLLLAVVGCLLFAASTSFTQLVAGRMLIGMGVAACLMAPLTYFRLHFSPAAQMRCNSWMLMSGSFGMVASTVPVQWLLPLWGWRGPFWGLAVLLLVAAAGLFARLPCQNAGVAASGGTRPAASYLAIARSPEFLRVAPMALVLYGGVIATQTLWAGPWLTQVAGWSAAAAGRGLLLINLGMLLAFLSWGSVMPLLTRKGIGVDRLMAWGVPMSLLLLVWIVALGPDAGAVHWMLWCVSTSVVTLSQPALAQAFPPHMAGRALSAFNLVVFAGVFGLQWGLGALIDVLRLWGFGVVDAYRLAWAGFLVLGLLSYLWFLWARPVTAQNRANIAAP